MGLQQIRTNQLLNCTTSFIISLDLENEKSEIYVVDSNKISKTLKTSHSLWLKLPGLKGQKHNDSTMRKLQRDYSNFSKKDIISKYNINEDKISYAYNGINKIYKPL